MSNVKILKDFANTDVYNRPAQCKECGGIMVYKGVGEYKCEDCGFLDYDDYGKVRNYIEKHAGVTSAQAAEATGVQQKTIRTMLRESRLEVAANSSTFLSCEMCGTSIRSGRFCPKCEASYHKSYEEKLRKNQDKMVMGYGTEHPTGESGARRFIGNQ